MPLKTTAGEGFNISEHGPADSDHGILIIHDWWGVKPYNREWAERFAAMGYRALVIDLYDGDNPDDAQEAGEIMRSIDQDVANRKLQAALNYLKAGQQRIAVLGWSFGGLQAQWASFLDPQSVAATIFYYCRILSEPALIASLQGPVLGLFSETERTGRKSRSSGRPPWPQRARPMSHTVMPPTMVSSIRRVRALMPKRQNRAGRWWSIFSSAGFSP